MFGSSWYGMGRGERAMAAVAAFLIEAVVILLVIGAAWVLA